MKRKFIFIFFFNFLHITAAEAFRSSIGFWRNQVSADPCLGASPVPGTICSGGAIYLGSLSGNKYMTTPGNCGEIPAGQIVGSGATAYPSADFTPTCTGATDTLTKTWNDGTTNYYNIPGLTDYTGPFGTGNGAINVDANLGSANTTNIVAITAAGEGGYHAAARYCDRLSYGGYTDWYLPNRAELNIMWTNVGSIPGLRTEGYWYFSSTEYNNASSWFQRFSDGYQGGFNKLSPTYFRCVRKY